MIIGYPPPGSDESGDERPGEDMPDTPDASIPLEQADT